MVEIIRIGNSSLHVEYLENYDFSGLDLHRALLEGQCLNGASFIGANLIGVFMSSASLKHAKFCDLLLYNANLDDADCQGADFSRATMGAIMRGANLCGAKFVNANMKVEWAHLNLWEGALYSDRTQWPSGFDPDRFGCIKVSE